MGAADRSAQRAILEEYSRLWELGSPPPPELAARIDALFAEAQGRVYAACRHILRNEEEARDVAQEALLTGYRKLHGFRGESTLATWLYGIARMLCFNKVRRRSELLTEDGILDSADAGTTVLSRLRREEREELIRQASASLEPLEQEAIFLRYVEDIPQQKITELLGLDQSSGARGLLQRCRRHLQRELRARLEALGHGTSFFRESLG